MWASAVKFHCFSNQVLKSCWDSFTLEMLGCLAAFLCSGRHAFQDSRSQFGRSEEMEIDVLNSWAAEQKRIPGKMAKGAPVLL